MSEMDAAGRLRNWRAQARKGAVPGYDHMRSIAYRDAPVCDADVDAVLDELERLRARADQLEREKFAADLSTGPAVWCWNKHPDHRLPCGRFAGHEGDHVRGERRWANEQQPKRVADAGGAFVSAQDDECPECEAGETH